MLTVQTLMCFFFFNDTATTEIYTLSLHDALPISLGGQIGMPGLGAGTRSLRELLAVLRSEEHTSELQSRRDLVCRLLLEKKKMTEASRAVPRDRMGLDDGSSLDVGSLLRHYPVAV